MNMKVAVPQYVDQNFETTPPGHRFTLYFSGWKENWELDKNNKTKAIYKVLSISKQVKQDISAVRKRQQLLLATPSKSSSLFEIDAISTAPLSTGLGLEHPVENGFAFLNPYGIPYLPGSSIKGVVRKAAEELCLEDNADWTQVDIDILFGFEPADGSQESSRGAIIFWDSIPEIQGDNMVIEIMTPHYGEYYQGNSTPHDAGQPTPIPFLAIPAQSKFNFSVTANQNRLNENLKKDWQAKLQVAFEHAFDWLGFGAKTAVGYGAMAIDEYLTESKKQKRKEEELINKQVLERQKALAKLTPIERKLTELASSRLDHNMPELSYFIKLLDKDELTDVEKREAAQLIKKQLLQINKWKESSSKKKPEKDKDYQNTLLVIKYL